MTSHETKLYASSQGPKLGGSGDLVSRLSNGPYGARSGLLWGIDRGILTGLLSVPIFPEPAIGTW